MIAAGVGSGWLALRPSTGLPAGPWTIGVHVPLSGDLAAGGVPVRNAVQLAIDQTNEGGGVHGVELAAKAYDTRDHLVDSQGGVDAATRMAGDPRTIAAVGPFTSPVAYQTIPITNRAGLLECSPSNSNADLTKPEHGALELREAYPKRINYVRLSPSVDVLTRALAAFATHDLGAESALVVGDGDYFGPELGGPFQKEFTSLGGRVERSALAAASSSAALRVLRRTSIRPDVVVFAGSTDSGAPVVRRAMSVAGLASTPFLSWDTILDGSGAGPDSYLRRAGDAAAGTYAGNTSIAPPRADFVGAYRAAFGEEPTQYAAAAYACMQVVVASLEAIAEDGPDAGELRESLRAYAVDPAHRYDTVLGTVGFDANGDATQQFVSFYRVDPEAADGAGDWVLVKQQDFGPPP